MFRCSGPGLRLRACLSLKRVRRRSKRLSSCNAACVWRTYHGEHQPYSCHGTDPVTNTIPPLIYRILQSLASVSSDTQSSTNIPNLKWRCAASGHYSDNLSLMAYSFVSTSISTILSSRTEAQASSFVDRLRPTQIAHFTEIGFDENNHVS